MTVSDFPPAKRFLMTLWFFVATIGVGYLAFKFKDSSAVKTLSLLVVCLLYWVGYGRIHYKVFKNTAFNKPIESLKGFSFFLLFLMIFLVVFGKYFIPYFR